MRTIHKIQIGSSVFFEGAFDDYKSKDRDYVVIVDKIPGNQLCGRLKIRDDDLMIYQQGLSKDTYIALALESENTLRIGKFLIPEFNKFIGFRVEDLSVFKDKIKKLDDAHKYQKIIYDAYLENGSFSLTDEQLNKAYVEYKKYRDYGK